MFHCLQWSFIVNFSSLNCAKNIKKFCSTICKRPFPCNNPYACYKNVLHYFSLLVFFVEFAMFRLLRLVTFLLRFEFVSVIRWSFLYQYGNVNSLWNSRTPVRHTHSLFCTRSLPLDGTAR